MRGIGEHYCPYCGARFEAIGTYLDHVEEHEDGS